MNDFTRGRYTVSGSLLAAALLAGCASQSSNIDRLPFHVAIAPPVVRIDAQMAAQQHAGEATELSLAIDADEVSAQLARSMSATFMQVSMLDEDANASKSTSDWARTAQAIGADMMLLPRITYSPTVHTSLNDRFWLNLPLFAIGGPLNWFVADRSYYCDTELAGQLIDVSAATAGGALQEAVDDNAKVIDITSPASEASLNFLDRADGAVPFLLSLVVPAGWLATESDGAGGALDKNVVAQVSRDMASSLLNRGNNITHWRLIAFHPRNLRVDIADGERALRGELSLETGFATAVSKMRYRLGDQDWQTIEPEETNRDLPTAERRGRMTYTFEIPLAETFQGMVRFEVTQNDRFSSYRTFSFKVQ